MALEQWFDGVYLLGQCNKLKTGVWLLVHQNEAALLECPPHDANEPSPAHLAATAVQQLHCTVKYLLCTHVHGDHYALRSLTDLKNVFPQANICLQHGFKPYVAPALKPTFFTVNYSFTLAGEPVLLTHAPKHSWTDTMVVFRGTICTGDWELGTLRSVHDGSGPLAVSKDAKARSVERMAKWQAEHNYRIHSSYSVHANDKRQGIDFDELMNETKRDVPLPTELPS
jgi:glyoxylase-like metal-dependent hydrolase (beta-lactamase superfamily II)